MRWIQESRRIVQRSLMVMMVCVARPLAAGGGDLVFEPHSVIPLGSAFFPTCVAIADVDGDGIVDLVVTGRNTVGEVALLRGLGGGDFAPPEYLLIGMQADWVEVRDFDGDGIVDLAILTRTAPGYVLLMRGRGNGRFAEPEPTVVGRFPISMTATDLAAAGVFDLIVNTGFPDTFTVLRNDGTGTFTLQTPTPIGPGLRRPARPTYFTMADFDDNGIPDILASHLFGPRFSILRGKADGTFHLPRVFRSAQATCATAADMTGNSIKDVALIELMDFGSHITIFPGDGTGGFAAPSLFPLTVTLPWWLTASDLDQDGRADLILTTFQPPGIMLFRNEAEGAPALAEPVILEAGGFPRMTRAVDLTGNCLRDLVTIDIAGHTLIVHLNDTAPFGRCPSADLNGDGVVDTADLLILLRAWNTPGPAGDLNLDGWVGSADLAILLSQWGQQ